MCCPCLRFEPELELHYDEALYDTEYTEVVENTVVRKIPTYMLIDKSLLCSPECEPEICQCESEESESDSEAETPLEPEPKPLEPSQENYQKVEKVYPEPVAQQPPAEPHKATANRYYLTGSQLIPMGDTVVVDIKPEAGSCECLMEEKNKTIMYMEPVHHLHRCPYYNLDSSDILKEIYKDQSFESTEESSSAVKYPPPPPPDIQSTIDKLRNAQPKKKTPGFPARNQRFIDPHSGGERRTEHVETHKFGPDFEPPIVQYKESYQNLSMFASTDGGQTYSYPEKYGETETILTRSETLAETDITLASEATTPLAEISQVKGNDLKWKIIIKEHKGKKDKKSHDTRASDDSS